MTLGLVRGRMGGLLGGRPGNPARAWRGPSTRPDDWPEGTVVSDDDIVVAGLSLSRLVDLCGTPAVHSGPAIIPGSAGLSSTSERTAVLVVRVVGMASSRAGVPVLQVDARLDNLRLVWSEARRIGGRRYARNRTALIVRRPSRHDLSECDDVVAVSLPVNLRPGDLLAIPSRPMSAERCLTDHPLTGRTSGQPDSLFETAN